MYLENRIHRYLFFSVLLLTTLACTIFIDRYHAIGGEELANPSFQKGLAAWRISGAVGGVKLEKQTLKLTLHEKNRSVRVSQVINGLGDSGFVRLGGEIQVKNVQAGVKNWHRARLVLSRYGVDGKWLALPNTVISLDGSEDWQHYEWIFKVVKGVARTEVVVQMLRATGEMWVRNLSLQRVAPAAGYKIAGLLLMFAWVLGALLLFRPYLVGNGRRRNMLLLLVALVAILIGTLLPASFKVNWQGDIKQAVLAEIQHSPRAAVIDNGNSEQIYLFGNVEIGKAGHFLLFGILFVLLLKTGAGGVALPLFDIAILAAATELLQNFVEGRSALCQDVLIDISGALVAGGIVFLLAKIIAPNNRLKKTTI